MLLDIEQPTERTLWMSDEKWWLTAAHTRTHTGLHHDAQTAEEWIKELELFPASEKKTKNKKKQVQSKAFLRKAAE